MRLLRRSSTFAPRNDGKLDERIKYYKEYILKIIACIKQVPDSEAKVKADGGQVSWGDAPLVINPFDEYAMEGALQQKEASNGTVTALCVGPESAKEALKHALAMGADDAILVSNSALANLDTQGAARVLAAAINKIGGVDMVVFGRQTLDNGAGLTPAQTARALGWPMLGLAGQIKVDAGNAQVERVIEEGRQTVKAKLPAVVSVVQSIGEPRYPSFMGIRKAAKAEIAVWSLSDLGIPAPAAVVTRNELMNPPTRDTKVEIITGDNPQEIAEKLADKILAEKVI
jgi:electron transfer flavoprotein beta subunit